MIEGLGSITVAVNFMKLLGDQEHHHYRQSLNHFGALDFILIALGQQRVNQGLQGNKAVTGLGIELGNGFNHLAHYPLIILETELKQELAAMALQLFAFHALELCGESAFWAGQ